MHSKNDKIEYNVARDEPGPAVVKLLTQLKGIQTGKVEDTFGWREPVRAYTADEYVREGTAAGANDTKVAVPSQLP